MGFDFVKGLGAKEVINYREQDWGEVLAGQDYDLIFDSIGLMDDLNDRAPKVLKKGGKFISIANFDPSAKGTDDVLFQIFLLKSKRVDLDVLVQMIKDGKLKIAVDKIYSFDETKAALQHNWVEEVPGKSSSSCRTLGATSFHSHPQHILSTGRFSLDPTRHRKNTVHMSSSERSKHR